jgi:sec-independent protein translocase protein TatB
MFDIGWGELLLIGIVALIAIGPKELPGALRALGQWIRKIRGMASEFQNQFHEAMREADLADLKKEVDEMAAKAQSYAHYDPMEDIRKDIENAAGPPSDLNAPVSSGTDAAATPAASSPAADAAPALPDATPATTQVAADPAPVAAAEPSVSTAPPATNTAATPASSTPAEPIEPTPASKPDAGRAA